MDKHVNTRFTIVTVVYNDKVGLKKTLDSVSEQTYRQFEYIVIDGGSTDGGVELLQNYSSMISYWVSEKDDGIYDAMNKAILKASGDYINFMNAGDVFYNNYVLQKVSEKIEQDAVVAFGDLVVDKNGLLIIKAKPFYEHLPLHHDAGFNHQCTFVKTTYAKRYPFNLNYRLAADYNMIITLFRLGVRFQQLDIPVAIYDLNGVSQTKRNQHLRETLEIDNPQKKVYNFILYCFFSVRHWTYSFLKKILPI